MRAIRRAITEQLEDTPGRVSHEKVAHNTVRWTDEAGVERIRLHLTDVLTFHPDGRCVLDSGGFRTVTTKDRLNRFGPAPVWQSGGTWYVGRYGEKDILFYDGIVVDSSGKVVSEKLAADPQKAIKGKIAAFIKVARKIMKDEGIPLPNNGDCWYCLFKDSDGKTMGEFSRNLDHLEEHLDEEYLHGSLILNALKHVGYHDPGVWLRPGPWPDAEYRVATICRALAIYLKDKFSVAR